MSLGRGRFLGSSGDTLLALDGRRLHRFLIDGTTIASTPMPPVTQSFLSTPARMHVDRGSTFVESMRALEREGGKLVILPERHFIVWRLEGDSAVSVASVALPQLPRAGRGGFFGSPAEAVPRWDLRDGCLALMDGSSARLLLVDVRTGARDTLELPLPDEFVDVERANATLPPGMRPEGELPPPALRARVIDLVLDPDGWLWLRPAAIREGANDRHEVWRFQVSSRTFVVDTVAGMAATFDPAGFGYRVDTDEEGLTRVLPVARFPR